MNRLRPYPSYKPSGVPWLGDMPEHWDMRRGKALFRSVDIRSKVGDEELLTVSSERGVVPRRSATVTMFKAESYAGYKLCWPGDLVINSLWAWGGGLGVSRYHGIVSSAYGVYRLRPGYESYSSFIHELVRSTPFHWELQVRSKGVWLSRLQLTDDAFLGAPFPTPPAEEQAAIVRYLDHMDRRIRKYIRAKQKLIGLLNDQRQAIIHKAVTRGLDPNVKLKPSGVPWLGDVPDHWEMRRLRYAICGKLTYGANAAAEHENPEWPRYLRITDFEQNGTLREDTFCSLPPEVAKDYMVQPGDILLARSGATVGKAFIVPVDGGPACHAGYLIRARPNRAVIEPAFLFAFTQSTAFAAWRDSTFIIATIQNIGADKYADLPIPVPSLEEQSSIMRFLSEATAGVDAAIDRTRREIALLREYRTRLVADVVTGKLDVREAAANLPEEAEEVGEPVSPVDEEPEEDVEDADGANAETED